MVQCLLRHGAGWCEDGVGDLLCSAVGMEGSYMKSINYNDLARANTKEFQSET